MSEALSANTAAILLLTAPLLTGAGEYGRLARRLYESQAEPADLLGPRAEALIGRCAHVVDPARLRTAAPAILYGCGERGSMSARGLAIVGSREAAEPVLGYARDVAAQAARAGLRSFRYRRGTVHALRQERFDAIDRNISMLARSVEAIAEGQVRVAEMLAELAITPRR